MNVETNTIIYYFLIGLFIFFFVSKFDFHNIILFVIIIGGLYFYYMNINKEKLKENLENKDKLIDKNIEKLKITNNKEFVELPYLLELNEVIKEIKVYNELNKFDVSFIDNINNYLKEYMNQLEILVNDSNYKSKHFEKLVSIKKEIIILLHSYFFKIDKKNDSKINTIIEKVIRIFKDIEEYLKEKIKEHFYENPNYLNSDINMYEDNFPKPDDKLDNNHLVFIN